jgi:hypothetical protein
MLSSRSFIRAEPDRRPGNYGFSSIPLSTAETRYVYYDHATNTFALVKDGGSETNSLPVGHQGVIENSQCSLDGSKSSVQVDANTAKVQLGLHFKPSFAGTKNIYTYAVDASGSNTGFVPGGSWVVTSLSQP